MSASNAKPSGEIVPLAFQMEASSTLFRAGDELRLVLQGRNFISGKIIDQPFKFPHNQQGICVIHAGTDYRNELLLPIIDKTQ